MAQTVEETAILLIAHGSRHAPANDDLHQLAARLTAQGRYSIVEPSFLELAEPDIQAGGDRCVRRGARLVLMIPYFLSAGVHLIRDLGAARGQLRRTHPGVEFRLGAALGPDPLLERLVTERIRQLEIEGETFSSDALAEIAISYAPLDAYHGAAGGEGPARLDTNRPKD